MSVNVPQTTFNATTARAIAGMAADAGFSDKISRVAAHDIGFGLGVVAVAAKDDQCDLPGTSADVFLGVSTYDAALPPAGSYNGASYAGAYVAGTATKIVRKGRIWVVVDQDVDPALAVYVRYATNGTGKLTLGAFRVDSDSSHALQVSNAKWITTTTLASGLPAQLEVNIP